MEEGKNKRLAPNVTISDCAAEVFCTRFSPDGRYLATGCGDGAIRVFNVHDGRLAYTLVNQTHSWGFGMPCTGIRFRPTSSSSRTKNVLLATNSGGSVDHWHLTSQKCLNSIEDSRNQLYALDYRFDGAMFATAGKDYAVRVYDEATKAEVSCLSGGVGTLTGGHSNRVFSVKFHPQDENILISGGWDNTLQIWDLRLGQSVRGIYGPHIAGDAVDINDKNQILTGSWRAENPLEIWDFGTGDRLSVVPWTQSSIKAESCFLYSAQFSKSGEEELIAAGGSGTNEAKVFNHSKSDRLIGTVAGLTRGVFSLDFSPDANKLVVAGADAAIRIIDVYDFDPSDVKARDRPMSASIRNAPPIHLDPHSRSSSPVRLTRHPSPTRIWTPAHI